METLPEELGSMGAAGATGLSCPDCSGVLEVRQLTPGVLQFRCRIGHTYGSTELLQGKEEAVERGLWSAVVCMGIDRMSCQSVRTLPSLRARPLPTPDEAGAVSRVHSEKAALADQ
jgi:hypothetical protein